MYFLLRSRPQGAAGRLSRLFLAPSSHPCFRSPSPGSCPSWAFFRLRIVRKLFTSSIITRFTEALHSSSIREASSLSTLVFSSSSFPPADLSFPFHRFGWSRMAWQVLFLLTKTDLLKAETMRDFPPDALLADIHRRLQQSRGRLPAHWRPLPGAIRRALSRCVRR